MKKLLLVVSVALLTISVSSKERGERCTGNAECGFNLECSNGVCVKKKAFDFSNNIFLFNWSLFRELF